MGIGVSVFLIAVGAILAFAVELEASGIDLNAVGVILLVVGVIGLGVSMVFWSSWGGWGYGSNRVVYHDDVYDDVPRRRVRQRTVRDDVI